MSNIDSGLSIEIFKNGNMKLVFFIPILNDESSEDIEDDDIFYDFLELLSDDEYESLTILNIDTFLFGFLIIFNQYINLLKKK